ncbi:MAG: hypothetical protein A3G70_06780 [Planctomycetes bacterium RIFCSPLOWO2_12_FULL_39_13]|nr:MAG: hypothetical protein A3G70_06780 [Planctomycetes bacterium RIFCSPLOWO2_12_FULL_39_13]
MKNKWIILLAIFTSTIIQNCASTGKITTEKQKSKTETVDKELYAELQALKSIQPIKFGLNVAQVKEQFPTPDKFEYDPMVNKNVTTLARDFGGRRVTFFFYEDKLYKVAIISKWSNYTLKFAEEYIKRTEAILIEGNGEPDLVEENETHKNMVWLNGDVEMTLELFNLMTHQGMTRVMTLIYADRNVIPLAKGFESFGLYKTRLKEVLDR